MANMKQPQLPDSVTHDFLNDVCTDSSSQDETKQYYADWAKKYDHDMVVSDYNGPRYVCDAFDSLGLDKRVRILDVLAGTGILAQLLKELGYNNIDALDGCQEMLDGAKEKNLYKNYICCFIGGGNKAPIADETYDALVMSGALGPGHIYADVFLDLLRITKKGGYICWVMRATHGKKSPRFKKFDEEVNALMKKSQWIIHKKTQVSNYLLGMDGLIYIMKKT